jgi:hypothetical protein
MLHVTCDLCGKQFRPGDDCHYVVKIEAYAAHDPTELTEADLDEDHMEAVSQLLQDLEDNLASHDLPEPCKNFRYDMCADCHRKFVRDPLGKETAQKFDFSEN